jgi:hypothetical protein
MSTEAASEFDTSGRAAPNATSILGGRYEYRTQQTYVRLIA